MNKIKIGVTGTRHGATRGQLYAIARALQEYELMDVEFHHGDCLGVDIQVAYIARSLGHKVICHPPESDYLRGFSEYDETRKPLGYLERDRNIVDETDVLFVVPYQDEWQPTGGTWYTHDYAVKKHKPIRMFYPKHCKEE